MNRNTGTFSRTEYNSNSRTFAISSPIKAEDVNKSKAVDLRTTLTDKMVEYATLQSDWASKEANFRSVIDDYNNKLLELNNQALAEMRKIQKDHASQLDDLRQQHQMQIIDMQDQITNHLSDGDSHNLFEEYDNQIALLKEEITKLDNSPPPFAELEELEDSNEDRLRTLEDRLEDVKQMYEEALLQREEESKSAAQMMEQLLMKNQTEEAAGQKEIQRLVQEIQRLDAEQNGKIDESHGQLMDMKQSQGSELRESLSRISQIQNNISRKQRQHHKSMMSLNGDLDTLKIQLDSLTTRQMQQMKEATSAARSYSEEKRKFVAFHKELEMLNSELLRETVEHETLLKELNKMDSLLLSSMSAVGRTSSSYYKSSKF